MAGLVYALSAFAIGFGLGTIRMLFVAPRLGATIAVLIEVPIILYASWMVARWCIAHFAVAESRASRALMGITAFAALLLCELGLSSLLFGRSIAAFFVEYASTAGAIGLGAQVLFAAFPYLQIKTSTRQTGHQGIVRRCNS